MKSCASSCAARGGGWLALLAFFAVPLFAATPFESPRPVTPENNKIDELVFARLQALNLPPAQLCSDPVFVRRVHLDVTGTLPTAAEARQFILDPDPAKRGKLIDRLLARDEYADYLALKWGDVLRIKAEFPINLWPNAAQCYHRWIRDSFRTNQPCDQFARQLLTTSGSNFEMPPVNFYRAMQSRTPAGMAQAVALTLLGERADHWPSKNLAGLAVFFANVGFKHTDEWKEEIVFFNPASTNAGALNGSPRPAVLPDGSKVMLSPDVDPRVTFCDWLVKDPQFARNLVNRAWYWLLGRGIVQEPDDFRADNPPSNPELLTYLAGQFEASGYDFKALYRLILNSKTYQLASLPKGSSPEAAANFACYPLRRLDAEVLIDAVDQVTGTNELYSSAIPEPYTFIPDDLRSIALPDGSITSSFLEMFGRPPRDTGLESERNNRLTAAQKLWLLNSTVMQRKIESSRMIAFQCSTNRALGEVVTGMYLGILSRFPTATETSVAENYFQTGIARRQATVDLAWALMNSTEFLYRH
ncbi:MAG TPA: DUF1553 domain-containing protein [Candidatus Acidoferrales bacterium]|nr:DUF1553 domain-containing protein [Candidatus Acidoferrales bacterium]